MGDLDTRDLFKDLTQLGKTVMDMASKGSPSVFLVGKVMPKTVLLEMGKQQQIPQSFLEYAEIRGMLTVQESYQQISLYVTSISRDRKEPFQQILEEGNKFAEANKIDSFSGIGLTLVTSSKATVMEKLLGLDLFLAQSYFLQDRDRQNQDVN
jgi:hypothetical protein